jgi:putative alpha-1,2-mannosidase
LRGGSDEVTISLDPKYYPGKTFKIKAYNNSKENMYIQKASLNGQPLNNCWFSQKDFARGGLLELWLGPKPSAWGTSEVSRPSGRRICHPSNE